jgi:hypothetical protein
MKTLADTPTIGLFVYTTAADKADALLHDANEVDTIPTLKDVQDFLTFLKTFWTPSTEQNAAIDRVIGTGGFFHGTAALPWRNFERKMIALQLIVRIADVKYIDQEKHPLCGPVSFMQGIARRNPDDYAKFVIDLATTRKGTINNLNVKVRSRSGILGKHPHRARIKEADYIALASLRNDTSTFPYRAPWTNRVLQGATSAHAVVQWMKDAGYTNVQDHSHAMWRMAGVLLKEHREAVASGRMQRNLKKMKDHLSQGDTVFMVAAGNLAHSALGESDRSAWYLTAFGGHFMLVRDMSIGDDGVRFDLVSWGKTTTNPPEVPWSKIGSWYQGFVCGTP